MKIITIDWNIFDIVNAKYEIARNGGSVMVSNISEYIGRKEESFLFQGKVPVPDMKFSHSHVIGTDRFLPIERTSENIDEWQRKLKSRFESFLKDERIDFVYVHGIGEFNYNCIEVCKQQGQPYAVVFHGCIFTQNKGSSVKQEHLDCERKIVSIPNINIITVSNGTKKNFLNAYPTIKPEQITVIVNGVPSPKQRTQLGHKKYDFGRKKILLCAASLNPNKNQMQLIRAASLLPDEYREKIQIVLCGKDSIRYPLEAVLRNEIQKRQLEDCVTYIGAVPVAEMSEVYNHSEGLVLPSLHEGLSLVVLEAIRHGKPAIMFADNETAFDVNSPDATILVQERTDQALADAIVEWYDRNWDSQKIMEYSRNFTIERCVDEYIAYARKHK